MRVLFRELVIEREERKGRGGPGKTRRFAVRLLGHATANRLWDCPTSGSVRRPVWVAYFGTEQESGPFTANFRASRKAATRNEVLQIPKKAPFRWTTQRVPGGVITVGYLPGYYPTPGRLLPSFASILRWPEATGRTYLIDPCAGDGTAIQTLRDLWVESAAAGNDPPPPPLASVWSIT